jgi:hypothetical protein
MYMIKNSAKMGTVPARFENTMNSAVTNMACRSLGAENLCGLSPFLYSQGENDDQANNKR